MRDAERTDVVHKLAINQSVFYFMSVHIEVILDKNKQQQQQQQQQNNKKNKKKNQHIIIIYTNIPTGL